MAISRAQLAKVRTRSECSIWIRVSKLRKRACGSVSTESSDRAFEEEVMLSGFGEAPVKTEGAGVAYDQAQEVYTAQYTHETIALAFSLTEEAIEDNLYDTLASRYTKALARSRPPLSRLKLLTS